MKTICVHTFGLYKIIEILLRNRYDSNEIKLFFFVFCSNKILFKTYTELNFFIICNIKSFVISRNFFASLYNQTQKFLIVKILIS